MSQRPVSSANPARPHGRLPIRVSALADLPGALGRLARLVAVADQLDPKAVGSLATEHARTVLTLAGVVSRRDAVLGTTVPPLLGAVGELLGHAATLADVGAATRVWRSGTPGDVRPVRQLREIRRQLGRDHARLLGSLTDSDLRIVIASLRPALQVAPVVRHAVVRHVRTGDWQEAPRSRSGRSSRPDLLAAVDAASDSAVRLAAWLPTSIRPAVRHQSASFHMAALDHSGRTR